MLTIYFIGAKAHSSADAIDIIANITPVRLRTQEVCTLEYLRIIRKPLTMRVRYMLENASVQLNRFTPTSYLKYQSKFFRRITDNANIEAEHVTQLSDVLDDTVVSTSLKIMITEILSVTNSLTPIFRLYALALSVIATATWMGGWLGGCHTPVLYQHG